MPNRGMLAATGVLGTVALCALLSGRGEQAGGSQALAANYGAESDATVVVHLTGLVLVVPPGQDGGQTHVLLPSIAQHAAWLGFGVAGDEAYVPRLCLSDAEYGLPALREGICYVDLDRWSLQPFGSGGQPTPVVNTLPPQLLNASRASGGGYGVHLPALGDELRAQVVFGAGQAGGHCSLASWIHEPVNARGEPERSDPLPLVNVLDWEMRNPAARVLVFRSRSGEETLAVPLPAPSADGRIELLLAHVPVEERDDLPPARPHAPAAPADTAHHFDAMYNLLRDRGTHARPLPAHSPNRRLPHTPTVLRPSGCEVGITVPRRGAVEALPPFASTLALTGSPRSVAGSRRLERPASVARSGVRTFSCVMGSGDRS